MDRFVLELPKNEYDEFDNLVWNHITSKEHKQYTHTSGYENVVSYYAFRDGSFIAFDDGHKGIGIFGAHDQAVLWIVCAPRHFRFSN